MSPKPRAPAQAFRVAGGLVDRTTPLRFSFDGKPFTGFAGDTLASALLASGERLVGRSFKYHRPRGILSAGPEEPNALVELRGGARREPNTRATVAELFQGLEATSQNRWPSLKHDLLSVNQIMSPLFSAGFYYKTFMWPAAFWEKVYEPLIRRAAGLGRAASAPDPDHYEKAFAFCDLLVVGGGPAGLSAALSAGRAGARVILADEDFALGGRLLAERHEIDGQPAALWLAATLAELASLPNVQIMSRTTVFGIYDHGIYGAVERVNDHVAVPPAHQPRQRAWRIVAKRAVLAAGSLERPIVFGDNDRPGVMLAGSVRAYVNRYGVLPGRRAVIFTAGDDGWQCAADLAAAGARVAAIIDPRPDVSPALLDMAKRIGTRVILGGRVTRALGMPLTGVEVIDKAGTTSRIVCDVLAMSNGWNPTIHLTCHHGGRPAWDEALQAFVPGSVPPGLAVAGAAAGRFTLAEALADGARLGAEAADEAGGKTRVALNAPHPEVAAERPSKDGSSQTETLLRGSVAEPSELHDVIPDALQHVSDAAQIRDPRPGSVLLDFGFPLRGPRNDTGVELSAVTPLWRSPGAGKAFVDFQNDVTDTDVELAGREGFRAVEHLKRYTTLGMATDQGKTSNLPGLAIMAELTGRSIPQVGTTIFRPPYTPVAIGALAGHHRGRDFRPTRLAPTHQASADLGAVFIESGAWLRAQYYPKPGETDWLETVNREVLATRRTVGVCDVSTLGKIDIQGADAGAFLDRVYVNMFSTLAIGKARYGLMLREDGFVMDDGTTSRLGPTHFLMTTTTANAGKVMQHLEFCHQVLWPDLDVQMVSVSDQWAQLSLAGRKARDVLRNVIDAEHDLSDAAVPYMAACAVTVGSGIPARLFRISFSGELAYEIAVSADYGDSLLRAVMVAGEPFGITPYGTEALGVMRIEKGHVAGNELSGQTTAADLGLGRMLSKKKDFVGRVLAGRPALVAADRPSVVGFKAVDPATRLRAGAHFVPVGAAVEAANDQGYMTSVAFSPSLGHWIGLGLLQNGPARIGERVRAVDPVRNADFEVEIVNPVFVDAEGVRLRG